MVIDMQIACLTFRSKNRGARSSSSIVVEERHPGLPHRALPRRAERKPSPKSRGLAFNFRLAIRFAPAVERERAAGSLARVALFCRCVALGRWYSILESPQPRSSIDAA